MVSDEEIKQEIWGGCIPIEFSLFPFDVTTAEKPLPYYVLIPRQSFFPHFINELRQNFESYVSLPIKPSIWLEVNSEPLRWHLPVGVLFDSLNAAGEMPWKITLRLSTGFPSSKILCFDEEKMVLRYLLNVIKESVFIRNGSIQNMIELSKEDQNQLWQAIKSCDFIKYQRVSQLINGKNVKKYPIRVHVISDQTKAFQFSTLLPASLLGKNGQEQTLFGLFQDAFATAENISSSDQRQNIDTNSITSVIIQGVNVDMATPLQWLVENCCHPDNFLHICVVQK